MDCKDECYSFSRMHDHHQLVERILRSRRENFTDVTDLDRFEKKFGTGDGVGEDNIGAYTGPRQNCKKKRVRGGLNLVQMF